MIGPEEYGPYYGRYVERVIDEPDIMALLHRQPEELAAACQLLSERDALGPYEPGKWSVREVVGHLNDTERIFAYRLLRIARGDATALPGFDQDLYVPAGGFDRRELPALLTELAAVRAATNLLAESLEPAALARRGTVNSQLVSARALVYIIAGHLRHHLEILRERYGARA